jgi:hypothetical protein
MNAPVHFKQRLAEELDAHAATLSAPGANAPVPVRVRSPRRRIAFTVAVAAAAAGLVIVPLVNGSHGAGTTTATGDTRTASTSDGDLNVVNADYSVQSRADGMVAVQLFDPKGAAGLQAALDKAKIAAVVKVPSATCHAVVHNDTSSAADVSKVVPPSKTYQEKGVINHLIDPSAIPSGDHLLFVVFFHPDEVSAVSYRLVTEVPSCVPDATGTGS